jgi:exo-beta-1,3-glucanase (GH17 family)
MTVSFEGIGENVVTFYNAAASAAEAGYPVKMSGSGEVCKAADGEAFVGVARAADADFAAVQTGGYAKAACSGTAPSVGLARLVADGGGGVKLDAGTTVTVTVGETGYDTTGKTYTGRMYVVVDVDTAAGTVGFIL